MEVMGGSTSGAQAWLDTTCTPQAWLWHVHFAARTSATSSPCSSATSSPEAAISGAGSEGSAKR
eukprot:11782272-Prorocentrum_lima.AAC.1